MAKSQKHQKTSSTAIYSSPEWKHPPKLLEPPALDPTPRITILGCGTSSGCPLLGCKCPTCASLDPKNKRGRASVVIQVKGRTFLIDTSPDLRDQALRHNLLWLDAVLFTHPHADHLHGIDELRSYNFLMGQTVPVYGNKWSLEDIRSKFRYIFEMTQEGGGKPNLALHLITKPKIIAGIKVTPLPVIHGKMPVLGYRIKDIAYITDCSYVPSKTLRSLKNLDVLVLDCLRPQKHATHLCIDEAIELAKKIDARRTYFTHMGHEIEYNEFTKSLPRGMYPAYDGLVIASKGR